MDVHCLRGCFRCRVSVNLRNAKEGFFNRQFSISFNQTTLDGNVDRFNTVYGGFEPDVTNTIFVHGELDPWRTIGR